MKVTLSLNKSIEENASGYFDKSKKAKRKLEGAQEALDKSRSRLKKAAKEAEKKQAEKKQKARKKHWYERFRWFFSSEGILCIGGRDATTNEQVIKKYASDTDIVLHCDIPGSPFFVVKADDAEPTDVTLEEAAIATASYSRAWRLGLGNVEVYSVKGSQLSKEAPSGEFMGKGSFMVRGKRNLMSAIPRIAIGIDDEDRVIGGPKAAITARSKKIIEVIPGTEKSSAVAKRIRKILGGGDLDGIIRMLPAGGCKLDGNKR